MAKKTGNPFFILVMALLSGLLLSQIPPPSAAEKNLITFARLYGYVKYFYPGDEAARLDWDRFAVWGVGQVEATRNRKELKKVLCDLFAPISPGLVIHESDQQTDYPLDLITPSDRQNLKPIYWQHLGLGIGSGSESSIYKSIRVERPKISNTRQWGNTMNSLPGEPYRGKAIRFRGAARVEGGSCQFWLRVDRVKNQMGFFDNMGDRPIRSGKWEYHEISGSVAADATLINYGFMHFGDGKVWVDDFRLEVKEGEAWRSIPLANPDFEEGKAGDSPAGWMNRSQSTHSLKTVKDTTARGTQCALFAATTVPGKTATPLFAAKPDFGTIIRKNIGSGLYCMMPLVLLGSETATYPAAPRKELAALYEEMEKNLPETLSAEDLRVRLADVVITWNVFQHFYPYFDQVQTDWPAALSETLAKASRDRTKDDFLQTLNGLVARVHDGHGRVFPTEPGTTLAQLPLEFSWVEKKLVINKLMPPVTADLRAGDIIQAINETETDKVMQERRKYISGATDGWILYRALMDLTQGNKGERMTLRISRDNRLVSVTTSHSVDAEAYFEWLTNLAPVTKKIEDRIYYINLNRAEMKDIDALMPELEKARSIICDLRGYPKDTVPLICRLLKEKDNSNGWMKVPQIIFPDFANVSYANHGWNLNPIEPRLQAKIIFITDGRAISYAESYLGFIEHYKLATIVGQPTAGTNGNINPLSLPGGFRVIWTGMRVVKHDGSRHHGVGILPQVRVERTIRGVREERDEFLEKAIAIARQGGR